VCVEESRQSVSTKKENDFHHIGQILKTVLASSRKSPDAQLVQIWQLWDEVVGQVVAENAQPEAFKGSLLLVRVGSSPWAQQLRFMQREIITKVNQALGKELVKEIRFKVG
jgi:predicted nucleic acid-binding Zn ribbon protein